ncbi:MAG: HNH endonuclease [Patescibacteria group bacterium]
MQSIPTVRTIIKQRDVVCKICGAEKELQIHHIVWKCFGGTDDPSNLILLCSTCHLHQHNGKNQSGKIANPLVSKK